MAAMLRPWSFLLFFIYSNIPLCYSLSIFPQNIETFYPFPVPITDTTSGNLSSVSPPPSTQQLPPEEAMTPEPTSKKAVVSVVVGTAAAAVLLSLFLFFIIQRCVLARRKEKRDDTQPREGQQKAFTRFNGNLNGFILEENGRDVIYWKKSVRRKSIRSFLDRLHNQRNEEREEGVSLTKERRRKPENLQEIPLLHGKSPTYDLKIASEMEVSTQSSSQAFQSLPPPPIPLKIPSTRRQPPPPPPPKISVKKHLAPPPPPKAIRNSGNSSAGDDQVKLKPLHWDKVNTNVDHTMVWGKLDGGSFRFDGDLMEALFGCVATNKKSPQKNCTKPKKSTGPNRGGRAQIFILDSRKSQNIAIILKSLIISRRELLDSLMEGKGLDPDMLEKLVRIAPTQEEQSQILGYDGDPLKLADAESFIFHLLKAVPTAFDRLNAMFLRSSYESELQRLRDFSQTIELGCEELRKKGLFTKLLEATLKAGNRMNAGTTRGNAEAFNLSSLLKLADVKSKVRKTTLLHFVVAEVVRAEGKKRFSNPNSKNPISKREKEIEYTKLGLPVVESLRSEFSNVKKASTIDYKAFINACSLLSSHISEIREVGANERGEFVRKMKDFVESGEEEIKRARGEQRRVLELVKKTTEFYETGDKNRENPIELFVIVRDFLSMVDEVCTEIARDLRGKGKSVGIDPYPVLKSSVTMRLPCLREHMMCRSISSESTDDDF